jgi:putative transposase
VAGANGKAKAAALQSGITERTRYRWRKECGGLNVDHAKRLKDQEEKKTKLWWSTGET